MPGRKRSYHHGDLRQAMLRTARELLEEQGPSALALREIARRLKVSAPAAYHHFKSLDEIAIALVEQGAKEMALCLDAAAGDERSLARSGEAYVKFALTNPALYRLMFGDSLDEDVRRSPAIVDLRNMADRIIRSRLEGHVEPAELAHASLYLWSLVHGLALLMIDRQSDAKSIEDVIRGVLKFAGRGLPPLPPVR